MSRRRWRVAATLVVWLYVAGFVADGIVIGNGNQVVALLIVGCFAQLYIGLIVGTDRK